MHKLVDIHGLGIERLATCKRKQAMRQCGRAIGRCRGQPGVALDVGEAALRDPLAHQIERADDAGEQIVEVVRDPPVSWPTASIFWDCRSCSSVRCSASAALRSAVTSRPSA